jgi:hypothetical protein
MNCPCECKSAISAAVLRLNCGWNPAENASLGLHKPNTAEVLDASLRLLINVPVSPIASSFSDPELFDNNRKRLPQACACPRLSHFLVCR